MESHEKIYAAVRDLMDNLGIHKYVFVAADPDSDIDLTGGGGEVCWRAGALQLALRQTLREWDDEDDDVVLGE